MIDWPGMKFRAFRQNLRLFTALFSGLLFISTAHGQTGALAAYTIEVTPVVGLNLPYDIWGTPGTLNIIGIRSAYSLSPDSSVEVGFLYHHKLPDSMTGFDIVYRKEMVAESMNTFFVIGAHFTKFNLSVDRDADGVCVPTTCATDSGTHAGFVIGAGINLPVNPSAPIRLGMRFYKKNPSLMLLLEAGVGIRF